MTDINIFFNELRFNCGAIWLESDTIKFSAPKKFQNQETNDFIKSNKDHIRSILKENSIFSKERFMDVNIFRDSLVAYQPLSPAQERLWFIEQYEGGTNAYHVPMIFEFETSTDVKGLKHALRQIVTRHEVLRSTIEQRDDQKHGVQIVHHEPLTIEEVVITDQNSINSLIQKDINNPFDLSTEYPIRVKFYYIRPVKVVQDELFNRTLLLVNTHHIASDGWSVGIFKEELAAYYRAYISGDRNFSLPALEIQYKDYAAWQNAYLTGEILKKQLYYWKNKLLGYQTLAFPIDHPRPSEIDYRGASRSFSLDVSTCEKLRELVQRHGLTLHSVMLGGISILLGKYTGQEDIVTGSPIANRHHQQTEGLIGFFVNTQANRVVLDKHQSYEALIKQIYQDQVEAQLNQDLPFEKLVDELGVARDVSRHPIFQVMVSVQSFGSLSKIGEEQKDFLKPLHLKGAYDIEKFDMSIFADDSQEKIGVQISYATALFQQETIERFIAHYTYLLAQLAGTPDRPYSQISLLDSEDYHRIVYGWNERDREYPKSRTVSQLFQEQAGRTPGSIALVCEGQRLTYRELNEMSNQLARYIRAQYRTRVGRDLGADTPIALFLDRGLEMVVGILGVLKAGGAYVPMDPSYPQERVDYILRDTEAELILSQKYLGEGNHARLPQGGVIPVDLTGGLYENEDASNLPQHSGGKDLAYIIYTSGTTGRPKGVMVEHRGVVNTVSALRDLYDHEKISRATAYTAYIFDVSVSEIFSCLTEGIELHILASGIRLDSAMLSDYLIDNRINLAYLPPILLGQLPEKAYPDLNCLIYAGEPCDRQTARQWSSRVRLFNYYGPTETSIYVTGRQILADEVEQIGLPIQNTRAYVLDPNGTPVPVGIIGELYLGGEGLARGYLKRPDLTGERFIPNPFATDADRAKGYTRLYRTGDLVRWLPDGNLEFIGRNDDQVKIRGFRVELGEIEHALTQIAGVKQGCVQVKERKTETGVNKYLVAYYVLEGDEIPVSQSVILGELAKVLPEYMIPSALMSMESFPMNLNGKLDRRALPDPDFSMSKEEYIAPTTEIEVKVCQVWQEVLGLDRVGITDNFFKMGGDSILAIQVSHRMSKVLGSSVKVASVFKYGCIEGILKNVTCKQVDFESAELEF